MESPGEESSYIHFIVFRVYSSFSRRSPRNCLGKQFFNHFSLYLKVVYISICLSSTILFPAMALHYALLFTEKRSELSPLIVPIGSKSETNRKCIHDILFLSFKSR